MRILRLISGLLAVAVAAAPLGAGTAMAQAQSNSSNGAPEGMIAYYTASANAGGTVSCPSGWTAYQAAAGYMILATTDSSQFGKTQGKALSGDLAQPMHSHPGSASGHLDGHQSYGGKGKSGPYAQSGNNGPYALTSGSSPTGYGFIQFVICVATASGVTDTMPTGAIAYFDSTATGGSCPPNWGLLNSDSGYFLIPSPTNGGIGAQSPGDPQPANNGSTNWNVNEPFPPHTHPSAVFTTFTPPALGMGQPAAGGSDKAMDNPIQWDAELSNNSDPVVPAIALMVCQKQTGTAQGAGIPSWITFYYSSTTGCPTNTGIVNGASGYFPIGIQEGGNPLDGQMTQGGTVGTYIDLPDPSATSHAHSHSIPSMTVNLGGNTTSYPGHQTTYAAGGQYQINGGAASDVTIHLPYIPLLLCYFINNS
ncbi:hypothetical protein [Inquilinus sp.]|uniref:hypothetical protein n=1 Tax=Inquilinus sp. TaxID=1932117 RepID=UPI0031CE977A